MSNICPNCRTSFSFFDRITQPDMCKECYKNQNINKEFKDETNIVTAVSFKVILLDLAGIVFSLLLIYWSIIKLRNVGTEVWFDGRRSGFGLFLTSSIFCIICLFHLIKKLKINIKVNRNNKNDA